MNAVPAAATRPARRGPLGFSGLALCPAALIIVVGWYSFSSALHGDWLWDDRADVLSNPLLRSTGGLRDIWFHPSALPDYYPVKATVQWVQWHLWGAATTGYHATNVLLHLWAALLFWRVLGQLGLRQGWLGALVFAVHPMMVESVAWIAELKNTLSLPPLLWSFSRFIVYTRTYRRRDAAIALLLFLIAMLCKTSVVMFPVTLLLFVWWEKGRITAGALNATVPFFVISLVLGFVTWWLQQHRAMGDEVIPLGGVVDRIVGAGLALAFYFGKCVWPAHLMPIYPLWSIDPRSALQWLPWPVIAVIGGWSWAHRSTWGRHVLFGFGWFVAHLLPFAGFVPISYFRFTWVMDHFVYAPILGLIGLGVAAVETAFVTDTPARRWGWLAVAAVGAVLVAGGSNRQARQYADATALWTFAARANPSAWVAHNNRGLALAQGGNIDAAVASYEAALRLKPDYVEAHNNLGNALLALRRNHEAAVHFEAVLQRKPGYAAAHNNLGVALQRLGRTQEAIAHLQSALRLNPDYAEACNNLGNALASAAQPAAAIRYYEDAVRLAPTFAEAHFNLALALQEIGRVAEARAHYETARRLNPTMPEMDFRNANSDRGNRE